MLTAERQQAIRQLLDQQGTVQVAELSERFGVSRSTIRRDLLQLERAGLIRRVHGGAANPDGGQPSTGEAHLAARIGRAAAARVKGGETVFLGTGSLTCATAKALAQGQRQTVAGLTVVTNSVEIAHWLANNARMVVVVTGGTIGRDGDGLAGPMAESALTTVRADKVILEAAAVSPDQGVMGHEPAQAELWRQLLATAAEKVALVWPDRVGGMGGVVVGAADELDAIITGREAAQAQIWDLVQLGVRIVTV